MLAWVYAMDIVSPVPSRNLDLAAGGAAAGGTIAARMETNCNDVRSASPSTFTLSKGRNNRLSILSTRTSLAERTASPPPSYDGLSGLHVAPLAVGGELRPDHDVSATLDAHLPLTISNKGWSEVESVSKQFLLENLPGWVSSMPEPGDRGTKKTAQQKQLSQLIKAGVRKSHKGLVLRLLRRTPDSDEIADLRLDTGAKREPVIEREPEALPELEAIPASTPVHQVPGIHEAPAELVVYELPTTVTLMPRQREASSVEQTPEQASTPKAEQDEDISLQPFPTESVLRTLSFGPEEASAWSEPVIDTSDSDHSALSSIVPTPTKGLSVRHATHRVIKRDNANLGEGKAETRMLPLDVESLNRRLLESTANAGGKQKLEEDRASYTDVQQIVPPTIRSSSHTEPSQEAKEATEHAPRGEQSLASKPDVNMDSQKGSGSQPMASTSAASRTDRGSLPGQGPAGSDDHLAIETASSKSSSTPDARRGAEVQEQATTRARLQVPEAPTKLKISTDCGSGSTGPATTSPTAPDPAQGLVALRSPPQEYSRYPRSPSNAQSNDQIFPAASHMYQPGDASQGTVDGSVTLPTLNLPEPDSPGGSLWLPSNIEIRPSPEKTSPLYSLLSHASIAIVSQIGRVAAGIYDAYGPEKPVPKDHVRVRWTCSCGQQLYDDFIERRRGAARELEAYLNRPRAHTSPSSPSSHSAHSSFSEPAQIFSANPSLTPSPATTWGSLGGGDSSPANSYSPTALRSNNPFSVRVGSLPPTRWLLTCADEGQFTPRLSHVDVTETRIRSDRDLAMAVRALYAHANRRWWRRLRLRGLAGVEFVQFEAHRSRVVDIRKAPDMPPKGQGYDFEPHDLVPPVGARYLMHLLAHPEDYDGEFVTYARAPKKRSSRLDVGVGWGIHLVDGFLADRVWGLVMGFFVLGSSVFAVVWACKRDEDVQGAFGVASWMLTLAVLVVGWAQAAFG